MTHTLTKLEIKTDVAATIAEFSAQAEGFEGVMLIGLTKAGEQYLRTSTMSMHQKSFLVAFLNAYLVKWFRLEDV